MHRNASFAETWKLETFEFIVVFMLNLRRFQLFSQFTVIFSNDCKFQCNNHKFIIIRDKVNSL